MVEHDVANVVVVGSNPITRSFQSPFFFIPRHQEMAPKDRPESDDAPRTDADDLQANASDTEDESPKLDLQVGVEQRGACERHVTVTVSRGDIDRYFDKQYTELVENADVPGFRHGHAPRKLIESRFRKDVGEQVARALVVDAIDQANKDEKLTAISEPDLDIDAVKLPDEGPLTFEFNLEVRPDFDVPQWKGLLIEKPIREFTEKDVDGQLQKLLARFGRLVPHEGAASVGDYLTINLTFKDGETVLSKAEEEVIRVRPVLSFRDGRIADFGKLVEGVARRRDPRGQSRAEQ